MSKMSYSLFKSGLPVELPFSVVMKLLVIGVSWDYCTITFLGLELRIPGPNAFYGACMGRDVSGLSKGSD